MGSQKSTVLSSRATCLCAPTTHAGSFRCRHHRRTSGNYSAAAIQPFSRLPNPHAIETIPINEGSRDMQKVNSLEDAYDLKRKGEVQPASIESGSSKSSGAFMRKPSRLSKVVVAHETSEEILVTQPTVEPASAKLSGDFMRKASHLTKVVFAAEDSEGILNQQASNLYHLGISNHQETSQPSSTKEAEVTSAEEFPS